MKNRQVRNQQLDKDEKFQKSINEAYGKIYGVRKIDSWEEGIKRVRKLCEITWKENQHVKRLEIKSEVNKIVF